MSAFTVQRSKILCVLVCRIILFIVMAILASLPLPGPAWAEVGVLDGNEDFKLLATQGFAQAVDGPHADGSPLNSYAWSMEWFNGALLVGTLRSTGTTQQKRAQIWRYTPGGTGGIAGSWKMVYQSPTSFYGPQDLGYRWMTACNVGGTPRLYVTTMGSQRGRILYSNDGITFREATTNGLNTSDIGYRPLVCFKDPGRKTLLITSPVGVGGKNFNSDTSNNPIVLATDNPISGTWRPYGTLRFGDSNNNSIFSIGARDTNGDGYGDTALYAGISNRVSGAQVWTTPGCSPFPCVPTWTKIVDKGAGRPLTDDGLVKNWGVSHITQHNNDIYVALSDTRAEESVSAELIRIHPDNYFDLIIGEPRLNVGANPILNFNCGNSKDIDGFGGTNDCPPLSGRGAGFGRKNDNYKDGNANYFWHMLSYDQALFPQGDGRLYVGTLDGGSRSGGTSGFDLLATSDNGLNWVQVTTDGLGDPSQGGARTITASPIGMFIGGANWSRSSSSETEKNGCAVWLGTCDRALARPPVSNPGVTLKSTMPGLVVFDGQRYVAYDDESYPNPGDGFVTVTLESQPYDPFCGEIKELRWDKGDLTANCGLLPGNLGTTKNLGPLRLCTSFDNVGDCPDFIPSLSASTSDYNEYTFTLQVKDNDNNVVCNKVLVRASKNLSPSVTIETDPPAVFSSRDRWSVNLVDFDKNGSQSVTLRGMCLDPEGQLSSCTWSSDPGVTFAGAAPPFTDADPGTLGTAYTATASVDSDLNIALTAVDSLGNKTALPVNVKVRSVTDSSDNDKPVCQGASRTLAKNTVLTVNPATDPIGPRCADPEGQVLTYVVTQPSAGTGTATGGSNLTYTPPQDFIGTAFFTLQACDPGGECNSAVGVRVNVQEAPPAPLLPPNPPATVSAAVLTGRKIHVTWSNVADETGYEVQRCQRSFSGSCSFSTVAANVPPNTTSIDNTVTSGGTYRFRVRACNANGCSAYTQSPEIRVR
jgi:hypothetical protein